MTAYYTLVQYFPDLTAEERMNVGVIAWDDKHVCSQFLSQWNRVRSFGRGDIGFLRDFAKQVNLATSEQLRLPGLDKDGKLDPHRLEKMIGTWQNSIQFSEPRGSVQDAKTLLRHVAPIFLQELSRVRAKRARSHRTAASIAMKSLSAAVCEWAPEEAERFVRNNAQVEGKLERHRFDVVLTNGKPIAALDAISFEVADEDRLKTEIDALAYSLLDVRNKNEDLPLAVFALLSPGASSSSLYRRASRVWHALDTVILTERKIDTWSRAQVRLVARGT